jgi:hypothetical protein
VYRRLQERWQADARRRWGEARPALEAWAQLWDPRQVANSLAQLISPFDRRPPASGRPKPGEPPPASTDSEIDELRRRLDQLERRLAADRGDEGGPAAPGGDPPPRRRS